MIERKECYLVTFHTTTEAFEMEERCQAQGIPGRLIPVPGNIKAGCGMAWCTPGAVKERLAAFLQQEKVPYEGTFEAVV